MLRTFLVALIGAQMVKCSVLRRHDERALSATSIAYITVTEYTTVYPSSTPVAAPVPSSSLLRYPDTTMNRSWAYPSKSGSLPPSPSYPAATTLVSKVSSNAPSLIATPTPVISIPPISSAPAAPPSSRAQSTSQAPPPPPLPPPPPSPPAPQPPSSTAVVIQPIKPSSTPAVVIQPVTPTSKPAVVIVPITPMALVKHSLAAHATPIPKLSPADTHGSPILAKRDLHNAIESMLRSDDEPATLTFSKQIITKSLPDAETPTPSPSTRDSSSKSKPSPTTSSKQDSVQTALIPAGANCPYPYPGVHCGSHRTTLVSKATSTTTRTTTKTVKASPTQKDKNWCPYPGRTC